MEQTQQRIEKLYTLQESNDIIARAVGNSAQESTLLAESAAIKQAIASAKPEVDLSGVESGLQEVKNAVENIELPEIDTSSIAQQDTLLLVKIAVEGIDVSGLDTSKLAQQGDNPEATNTAIYNLLNRSAHYDSSTGNLTIENVQITIE